MRKDLYLFVASILLAINVFVFARCIEPAKSKEMNISKEVTQSAEVEKFSGDVAEECSEVVAEMEDVGDVKDVYAPTYVNFGVPTNVNTSFKTYMDWRTITSVASDQYKLIRDYAWCDEKGFMRIDGEHDLGIEEDYYVIALGSYYGTKIGTKYRITTDTGNVFYGILGDCKADIHTNSTHQYSFNNDVVEFVVDTRYLDSSVKRLGSGNAMSNLNGQIAKIERIDF